jgi:hypothetical protein
MSAQHRAAEVLYKSAQPQPGAPHEAGQEPPRGDASGQQGDVIDAEVVEDEKK